MLVRFEINGVERVAEVVSRGFFRVDAPECYEVKANDYGFTKFVPVSACQPVN